MVRPNKEGEMKDKMEKGVRRGECSYGVGVTIEELKVSETFEKGEMGGESKGLWRTEEDI